MLLTGGAWLASTAGAAGALTLAEVTPAIAPAAPLSPREAAIIDVYDRSTYSVVNIFDATLQVCLLHPCAAVVAFPPSRCVDYVHSSPEGLLHTFSTIFMLSDCFLYIALHS